MYKVTDYMKRGMRFVNNNVRPRQKKLSTLMLYTTDLCNSRCLHCYVWEKRPPRHLSFEKIVEIMGSKCVTDDTTVGLEGGEFLLHPEKDKILGWFSEHHPNFELLSNCLKPEIVIEAVELYKPKRLYISLDGSRDTYKYMRGVDGFDKVIQVVEACKDAVPVSLMFTLSPYNTFDDLKDVIEIAALQGVDLRIGLYNNIDFFDTKQVAHEMNIQQMIPDSVKSTSENYDFLLLYDEWRKNNAKLKCHSILDSLVVHPNGDIPLCQNLSTKLGNVHRQSLDEIFNSQPSVNIQRHHSGSCNKCWVNFHRKYDIVLLRSMEKMMPKRMIELFYGEYQWCANRNMTYKEYMNI